LADTINLDDVSNSDEDAKRGMNEGVWMRAVSVIVQDDNEQLYAKFEDEESAEFWLELLEPLSRNRCSIW